MLKTVALSQANKTAGCAVTYRAGAVERFGTCPKTCELNPCADKSTNKIDLKYLRALIDAVPPKGRAFTYTHFAPHYWRKELKAGGTTVNYSARDEKTAIKYFKQGIQCVTVVNPDHWENNKKSYKREGVQFVRCPQEQNKKLTCGVCKLCAYPNRNHVIVFTQHGCAKDNPKCYADNGRTLIHWNATKKKGADNDAEALRDFADSLPIGTILRHHVAGDIGQERFS